MRLISSTYSIVQLFVLFWVLLVLKDLEFSQVCIKMKDLEDQNTSTSSTKCTQKISTLANEYRYVDRIITKKEKEKFADSLKKHQKAILYDDFSVLDRAVIEHNIVAISKLYETISFDSLSKMLDIARYPVKMF